MSNGRTPTQDTTTRTLIRQVVQEFIQQQRPFFALEVTNEVKLRGAEASPALALNQRHQAMAPVIEELSIQGQMDGYRATAVAVDQHRRQANLYHPAHYTATEIARHMNRVVEAVPPVEVLLRGGTNMIQDWRQRITLSAASAASAAPVRAPRATTGASANAAPTGTPPAAPVSPPAPAATTPKPRTRMGAVLSSAPLDSALDVLAGHVLKTDPKP